MSIFEPIPRESRSEDAVQDPGAPVDDDAVHPRGSLDPRSIKIAGLIVATIVALGMIVSNAAQPDAEPRPALVSRGAPGAAAVEQAEATQADPAPTVQPASAPTQQPSAEPVDDDADEPAWQAPDGSSDVDYTETSGSKWDNKPGKGHGRGRG